MDVSSVNTPFSNNCAKSYPNIPISVPWGPAGAYPSYLQVEGTLDRCSHMNAPMGNLRVPVNLTS